MAPPRSLPGLPENYTSQFFQADTVTKRSDPTYRGKVVRAWADDEGDLPPLQPGEQRHPLDRELLRGEVGISDVNTSEAAIVPEADLELIAREFLKGDIVKHALTDVESAVVLDVKVECQLVHVISGQSVAQWVPWEKLKNAFKIEARDKVVYDEWIGTVEEVFEDGLIEATNGSTYRIVEMGGLLEPGRVAADVFHGDGHDHIHTLPRFAKPERDRVVQVRPVGLYITWNAINQELPVADQDKHPEPRKFWSGMDIEQLTLFDGMKGDAPPIGTAVIFRSEEDEAAFGVQPTFHDSGNIRLTTCKIKATRTKLKLRWQDGTETEEWGVGFVPYRNLDDYESWPGEHLVWRDEDGTNRPAVVQSFNPHQRVADLYFPSSQTRQTVSVLDIDVGGFGKTNYGVRVGQFVLFTPDNGSAPPEVPSLGQLDSPLDRDIWQTELDSLSLRYARNPARFGEWLPKGDPDAVQWWGEVTDLHLDGSVSVELWSGRVRRVEIKNLVVLNEPLGDPMFDPEQDDGSDMESVVSDASWETMSATGDVEYMSGDEVVDNAEGDMVVDENEDGGATWTDAEDGDGEADPINSIGGDEAEARDVEAMVLDDFQTPPQSPRAPAAPVDVAASTAPASAEAGAGPSTAAAAAAAARPSLADDDKWVRFDMFEEAPAEHHFYKEPVGAPSKAFHSRIGKEHRALATSLPENILVRTYEDRTDLMRVLIVGPEGTPYNDAPFVFDVYLNPTKFPFDPPQVYFHSHTNGHGRCNPNLYEDGKVCLSILGTWSGDKSESWNPTKSSLLQVFVSISGLVLVRSPYHCEPAFAKLEGTREGRVNSRLYSEKAYVLSRSFVRTALDRPPAGFADELTHFYLAQGRLRSVIAHARALMEKGEAAPAAGAPGSGSGSGANTGAGASAGAAAAGAEDDEENAEMWNADAMGSLTMGAILTLKRTIVALEKILETRGGGGA
ncbi:hypothetical protein Q5752_003937 [Cryptotrichosporon argae]